jgi:hypothetical protein
VTYDDRAPPGLSHEEWTEAKRRVKLFRSWEESGASGLLFPNGQSRAPPKHFELIPFDAIRVDTAPAYLIKGIVPRVGLCVFWGPPKCGKSFLVFDLLMHVALGWEYRGRKVRQGPVVYCALEGCSAFKNRIEAFRQSRLQENASNVPFRLMAAPLSLVVDHTALIASIKEQSAAPAIVAIDTLNRSSGGHGGGGSASRSGESGAARRYV